MDAGVPVAPTIFAEKGSRSAEGLLQEIQARGWKDFFIKQSYSCGSVGFTKLQVAECKEKPAILEEYFSAHSRCPEFVVQEFIEGFCRNWEVRCFWFNGEFQYAIANRAAVSCAEGEKVGLITEDQIPAEFLENAKRIGKQALASLPPLTTPNGQPIGMTLVRTDIGCSDSKVYDRDTHWDPSAKTFFLNEIEYGGTTYFPRALKFDCIPRYAKLYASKALEIHEKMSLAAKAKTAQLPASLGVAASAPTVDTLGDSGARSSSKSDTSDDMAASEVEELSPFCALQMSTRVGFILGKEYDYVDTPDSVVDTSFLKDLPPNLRARPAPRFTWPGMAAPSQDQVSTDMAIAWYVHKHFPDIEVDFILPSDISRERLQSNVCNFIVGYDVLDSMCEGAVKLGVVTDAFKTCGNIMPSWEVQEAIYMKSGYMKEAARLGVPMAPTIFAAKGSREPQALLEEIQARGWQHFVLKQSYGFGSAGFVKMSVAECKEKPAILEEYFSAHSRCPEFVVQEFIEGFCRNWEVRCFWFNGEFQYAIANRAAVSCAEGEKVGLITEDQIPAEFLENAKRIGKQALASLPPLTTPNGQPIGMTLVRTDIGCADSKVNDKDTHWDPSAKTFFLNEIEYGGTTYFP